MDDDDEIEPRPIAPQRVTVVYSVPMDSLVQQLERNNSISDMRSLLRDIGPARSQVRRYHQDGDSVLQAGSIFEGEENSIPSWSDEDEPERPQGASLNPSASDSLHTSSSIADLGPNTRPTIPTAGIMVEQGRLSTANTHPFLGQSTEQNLEGRLQPQTLPHAAVFGFARMPPPQSQIPPPQSHMEGRETTRKTPQSSNAAEAAGRASIPRSPRPRELNEEQWEEKFQDLERYREEYGDCLVPYKWGPDPSLAQWVKRQRFQYKLWKDGKHSTMTDSRRKALENIGFSWSTHGDAWTERLNELMEFKEDNGHTDVPNTYPENPPLSLWVKSQRRHYKTFQQGKPSPMTQERITRLEQIGFQWTAPARRDSGPPEQGAEERKPTRRSSRKPPPRDPERDT